MSLNFLPLQNEPRLLVEADLKPVQGHRFQATGFPNLGSARYNSPDGQGEIVLVESPQSMANRMEAVCWDKEADDWVPTLKGLPVIKAKIIDRGGERWTNSVLEAHRINSEYIARTEKFKEEVEKEINFQKDSPFDVRKQLVPALLKFDINSLIHGVFLEEVAGVIRLPRTLSAFIEASGAHVAASGGVKVNRVEPGIKGGGGNVIYAREEWVAEKITAFFNLDLRQIRAFGLGAEVEQLLIALALFKIRKFLMEGLRLRTACDLDANYVCATRPDGFGLPNLDDLEEALPGLIRCVANKKHFGDNRVLTVTYGK